MLQNTQSEDSRSLPEPLPGVLVLESKEKAGNYSDVYKGRWFYNGQEQVVCIKCLRNTVPMTDGSCNLDPKKRFALRVLRETTIWMRACHPNVLPFLGHQIEKEEPRLVSPWMKNGSLLAYLAVTPCTQSSKLKLLREAAEGLKHLHGLDPPIAHGDLKPENIIITDDGIAALCDMGVSRIMLDGHTGLTTSGSAPGSAGFQAKELIMGESLPTTRSDIYAMGGVILETLSGKKPFHTAKTYVMVMLAIHTDQMPMPADHEGLPEENKLWPFLRLCWSPKPENRPTADDVVRELETAIKQSSPKTQEFSSNSLCSQSKE